MEDHFSEIQNVNTLKYQYLYFKNTKISDFLKGDDFNRE